MAAEMLGVIRERDLMTSNTISQKAAVARQEQRQAITGATQQ